MSGYGSLTTLFRYSKTFSLSSERENHIILVHGLLNYEKGRFWLILVKKVWENKRYDFKRYGISLWVFGWKDLTENQCHLELLLSAVICEALSKEVLIFLFMILD